MTALTSGIRRVSAFRAFAVAVCALLVAVILYPLSQVVVEVAGLGATEPIAGDVLRHATSQASRSVLYATLLVVAPAAIGALLIAAVLAWLNERTDARIGWLADVVPILPLFVPPIAGAIGWMFLGSPSSGLLNHWIRSAAGAVGWEITGQPIDIFTWPGLIAVYTLYLAPFAYISLSAGFRNLDPSAEEAARVSGAGAFETLRRVTLPSLGPSIGAAMLIVVAVGLAMFSLPLVIGTTAQIDVLSVTIVRTMTRTFPADRPAALGLSLLLVLLVASAWLLQRKLSGGSGYATIGGRGVRHQVVELGRMRWVARGGMLAYLSLTSILPVTALLLVSFMPFWRPQITASALTLDNYSRVFGRGIVAEGLRNSLTLGVIVATVGTLLAALVAYAILSRHTRWGAVADGVTKLPFAMPNVVFALALLVAFAGPPFRLAGTSLILMIAYISLYFPHASLNASSAFLQVGSQIREAAAVAGASDARIFRRILLPLMLPGLVAGWAFLFVLVAGDVDVAALLASTRTPVVGFVILDLFSFGTFPALAALAVVMTLLSTMVVTSALVFARRSGRRASA